MPEQLWLTELLNRYFGPMTTSLLRHLGIEPAHPQAPITNPVAMEMLVVALLIAFFLAVRATLSVDKPRGLQHYVEIAQEFVGEQAHAVIGHDYQRYVPYAMALGFFILFCNLLGLIPFLGSPTASIWMTVGLAICSFIMFHAPAIAHICKTKLNVELRSVETAACCRSNAVGPV